MTDGEKIRLGERAIKLLMDQVARGSDGQVTLSSVSASQLVDAWDVLVKWRIEQLRTEQVEMERQLRGRDSLTKMLDEVAPKVDEAYLKKLRDEGAPLEKHPIVGFCDYDMGDHQKCGDSVFQTYSGETCRFGHQGCTVQEDPHA